MGKDENGEGRGVINGREEWEGRMAGKLWREEWEKGIGGREEWDGRM